ncbi:hypothetical protein NC652_035402 [Populus alba x Populus x berolinensis]|nr:hypothetical protein NC652_035402 [Populus alba x Populus x berolinensis]
MLRLLLQLVTSWTSQIPVVAAIHCYGSSSRGRGFLLPFSIQRVSPLEKAQPWELLYSTLSLSA